MSAVGKTFEPVNRRSMLLSRPFFLALATLILAASTIAAILLTKRASEVDRGTSALVKAFSKRRLIEPWLSGGFTAGKFDPTDPGDSGVLVEDFNRGRELITEAMAKEESSARIAYARLLLARSEKLSEAQRYLRRAIENNPGDSLARNDLGVCFIQQGKLEDALEEFDECLRLKPDLHEALFNRALCFQRLLLRDVAAQDLDRLLKDDIDDSWRKEIRQRQTSLTVRVPAGREEKEIVASLHSAVANHNFAEAKGIVELDFEVAVKHALFDGTVEYLNAALTDQQQRDSVLFELNWIGDYILSRGDACVSDLASYLTTLPQEELSVELHLVKEYRDDEQFIASRRYSEAQTAFKKLSDQFAARGNVLFKHFSDVYIANCLYADGKLLAGLKLTREALAFVEKRQWPYMRAQRLSDLSVIYSRLDHDSLAIEGCEQAKKFAEGSLLIRAKAAQSLGNAYWRLGNLDKALTELRESTNLYLMSGRSSSDLANNYLQIADIYRLSGSHRLGMLFAGEALELATTARDYRRAAQASSWLAVEQARLGKFEEASESLNLAFERERDYQQSAYTKQIVLSRAGEVAALKGDTEAAAGLYSKAEMVLGTGEDKTIPLLAVLRGRASSFERAKQFEKANADLDRAIQKVEGYRSGIADSQNRSAFMDASQGVFDQAIKLNIEGFDRKEKAFELSEESRARVLLDQLTASPQPGSFFPNRQLSSRTPPAISKLSMVQDALPEGLRLLSYSVTDERTYLFSITRNSFEVAKLSANIETLDRLIREYVSFLKNPDSIDDLSERGRKLYEHLIAPIESSLADGKALCIVPDKSLHFLPFAALVDGSGHYFVESHRLTYAPSATVLIKSIEQARSKGHQRVENFLAVGNPLFNRQGFPLLKDLPDAEIEAREAAASYANKKLLIGSRATEVEVREQLKTCDVAHFAVHCIVAEKSPWLAALVLAGREQDSSHQEFSSPNGGARSTSDDGLLYLNELYDVSMPRARLVVLSACETGLGQYYRGEGIVSLIRPFLAARVPAVIASLWAVDSRATAQLMIELHKERSANAMSAPGALQASQIKMIRSELYYHPYYWAPFISVGADS